MKMTINNILSCFNKVLDINGNPDNIHYIASSYIEKNIGPIKTAYTTITKYDPKNKGVDIIKVKCTNSIPKELEESLIEESQRKALIEFIQKWNNDTGIK